jgi:pimeloyl-ACP methyl ester carboxylesterase
MSDKKQKNELAEVSETYNVELGVKGGAGRSIHYTLVHSDSALPLAVFIHGSPGSSSNYIQFAQDTTLLARYNVLLIDRPGYGYSGFGNAEKSIEQQSKILREVVSQFPYARKYLVGHSLGGPIVCRMAMDEPSLPAGLLIIAGSVSPDLEPQEKWRKPLSRKAIRWLLPRSFRVSNDEILPAKQELINMAPLWPKIKCDVQIIQGGQDNLVPSGNEDYAEKMLVNAKSVRVYRLPEEDHFIPFSHPGIVTEKLLLF